MKGKFVVHICKCGKNFDRPYWSIKNGSRTYCSVECKKDYGREIPNAYESDGVLIVSSRKYGSKKVFFDIEDTELIKRFIWGLTKPVHMEDLFYVQTALKMSNEKWGTITMHRLVMNEADSKILIDHADHDGLNCRKYNLRKCTHSKNAQNRKPNKNSSSQYLGVCKRVLKNGDVRWRALIRYDGKTKEIGAYLAEIEAALAYDNEAKKHFGEFANLNFKDSLCA